MSGDRLPTALFRGHRCSAIAAVTIAAVVGGCGRPAAEQLHEVRAVCDMNTDAPLGAWWTRDGTGPETLDVACVERLAQELYMDWELFHQQPKEIGYPQTSAEVLIWSAYTLFASDVGTTDELDAVVEPYEQINWEYGWTWRSSGVGLGEEATVLWYHHYRHHVRYLGWVEREGCVMFFDGDPPSVGGVFVCDDLTGYYHPLEVAAVLLHEAGHRKGPDHIAVPLYGRSGDRDAGGTYGLQTRWLWSWFEAYDGLAGDSISRDELLGTYCAQHMIDVEGFGPCEGML